ncbi:MAG: Txe/YoeB family addiction module toxin [Clostridia bacterium]|nr:Txe/YoeB family addiction module toxin [Clostridia bacterium]
MFYSKKAVKEIAYLKAAHLDGTVKKLIAIIRENPYQNPPPFEKLVGNLQGLYSRRINIQHRLVYDVRENEKAVMIFSMWTHYGDN